MKRVKVELQWLRPNEGGRPEPPLGPAYTTVAKLEALAEKWPAEAWSIFAEWKGKPDNELKQEALMRFLVEGGPEYLLVAGGKFELYEGRRMVARGKILNSNDERNPER